MGHSGITHKIINYLKGKFNFNFYVVDSKKKNLDAEGMLNLMLKADICVSAGGQTTYELARVGIPTIGICFAENQRLNLEAWRDGGFIDYIGWYNDGHLLEKIEGAIDKFLPYKERIKSSQIGRDSVDGKGVARIVDTLLKRNGLNSRSNLIKKSQS